MIGSTCGIHGCQRVTISHKAGGDLQANIIRATSGIDVSIDRPCGGVDVSVSQLNDISVVASRVGKGISTTLSLVCQTSQGSWEYLMVREGEILLIDGERVMVRRK